MSVSARPIDCFPLIGAQAIVAFNDNAAKFMLAGLASATLTVQGAQQVNGLLALLLVLPFVALAPVAGWLADRHAKTSVIRWSLLAQMAGLAVIYLGAVQGSLLVGVAGFALLALQSSIFSPAKYGVVKEIAGPRFLGMAVGAMELTTVLAILVGGFAGGFLFDWSARQFGSGGATQAATLTVAVLALLAVAAYGLFLPVRRTPVASAEGFRPSLLVRHLSDVGSLWRERTTLRLPALGGAFAWSMGSFLVLVMLQLSAEGTAGAAGTASTAGLLMLLLGLGVATGCGVAALVCRTYIELGLVPVGFALLTAGLATAVFSGGSLEVWGLDAILVGGLWVAGLGAGLFLVPLNARLQERSDDARRGRNLAAANLVTNLGTIASIALYLFLAQLLGLSAQAQFAVVAALTAGIGVYALWLLRREFLRVCLRLPVCLLYRIRVQGRENIPAEGPVLLVANHIAYVDALMVGLVSPRPVRFLAMPEVFAWPLVRWIVRLCGVIPTSAGHARSSVNRAVESLRRGEVVCIFPEGVLTRTGTLGELKRGFSVIAGKAQCPVVPLHLDGLWGSVFSFKRHRWFWKKPEQLPCPVNVTIAPAMTAESATVENVHQALLDMGAEAMTRRPELQEHLGQVLVRTLKQHAKDEVLVDYAQGTRTLTGERLLIASLALAEHLRQKVPEERIGVVFPPGIGAAIANFAIALAGKSAVNLNVTLGRDGLSACIEQAELKTFITAAQVLTKVEARFPGLVWPEQRIDLPVWLEHTSKLKLARIAAAVKFLPARLLARLFKVPHYGGDTEAAILFSSGSVGAPKGITLTHRNLLAQKAQIDHTDILPEREVALANLPVFHSFGYTVLLWYAMLKGVKVVAVPSPLDVKTSLKAIREQAVTVMLGSPTFLRPYLRQAQPEDLKTVKWVVAGAEKTPPGYMQRWEERFPNTQYLEGYGLTETAPVVAVNLPNVHDSRTDREVVRRKEGTVGRLFGGMAARIRHPDTGELLGLGESGLLLLKGPNVFKGYLNDPDRTQASFDEDGWFVSGDLAWLDPDGFLTIEGRLSRFSKIGGEMVPHGTIEEAIAKAFGLEGEELPCVAVGSRSDPEKGEALVLFTTVNIQRDSLGQKLADAGLPNLWIPRDIRKVEAIPVLASGKLDLKTIRQNATEVAS
ncbi:MAG: MFS transporter [Opitutales bacterium]